MLAGDRQDLVDAVDDPLQPLAAVDLGIALAGEHPADRARAAQPPGDGDQLGLAVDGALARVGVGIGEVGRAAEHRHREARRGDRLAHPVEISRLEAGEEPVVHLQAVGVERPRHLDPVEDRHRSIAGDLVDVALGKSRDLQRHAACLLAVDKTRRASGLSRAGWKTKMRRCRHRGKRNGLFSPPAATRRRNAAGYAALYASRLSLAGHGRPRAFLMMFEIARVGTGDRRRSRAHCLASQCSFSSVVSGVDIGGPRARAGAEGLRRPHRTPGPICPPATK